MLLSFPIWLFALAAISIPVIIHLWNIKPGKTLKVGSIALFNESSPKSSRSFKVMDLLLLLLRCLLLILLAFILAAPLWQQYLKASKVKGWVLIPEADFNETYQQYQHKVDALIGDGYEFHLFKPGFPKQDLTETKAKIIVKSADTLNYWSLINQLSNKITERTEVELFTPNTIIHFTGEKPTTALHVNWHTYPAADSVSTWLAGAWLKPNGDIRVAQGTSAPTGTTYQYNDIKNGGQAGSNYQVGIKNGVPVVSLKDSKIIVDTTTQRIAIYTDRNSADANYLRAALYAIAQLTGRKTIIKQYSQPGAIPAKQDWLFWLSTQGISKNIIHQHKNIFHYEDGKVSDANSWLSNAGEYTITQGPAKIPLYKSIAAELVGDAVWTDGFGHTVLSLAQGQNNVYHFYNRFNPAWNDLVWSNDFPKWIMQLMNENSFKTIGHDRRVLSEGQIRPNRIAGTNQSIIAPSKQVDLSRYLWLGLVLVFFIERWLATKNKQILANG
jgi:hypothetical protein